MCCSFSDRLLHCKCNCYKYDSLKLPAQPGLHASTRIAAPPLPLCGALQWVLVLSEAAESTAEHWRAAFDSILQNAAGLP